MKFFAVIPALLAAAAGEAALPIHSSFLPYAGLYNGGAVAAPYAAAYNDARFAYGVPVTAYNARLTPAPVIDAPVAIAAPVSYAGYSHNAIAVEAAAPVAVAHAAPVAVAHAAPIAGPVSSQFQAQDEFGNIAFGYQNINSARQEEGNTYGGVTGSYSFVDEAGHHTVNYIADHLGFRVAASNLPVAPVHLAAAPIAVADTPAVAAAKADFFNAYAAQEALNRKRRDVTYAGLPTLATGYAGYPFNLGYAGQGFAHAGAYAAPIHAGAYAAPIHTGAYAAPIHAGAYAAPINAGAYAAPINAGAYAAPVHAAGYAAPATAAREATLTTIKLNPGHATFYRVFEDTL